MIDIGLSFVGIVLFSPLILLIGLLIKLDSKGPVLYAANRIGRDRKNFRMWKFRTMIDTPIEEGESVCPQFDPRVTSVGRFLRRSKINELPQLFNILKGEMTFVGPRPEAPDLADLYPEEAKRVFSVTPGLVGPASILGRNEEEIYPPGVDAKMYYIAEILPSKNRVDLEYIDNPSLLKDIRYILTGVKVTLIGAISKRHLHDNRSQVLLLACDVLLIACSYVCASCIWSLSSPGEVHLAPEWLTLAFIVPVRLAWNIYFRMYCSLIRYLSYSDVAAAFKSVTAGSISLFVTAHALDWFRYPTLIAAIDWASLIILLSGLRLGLRLCWDMVNRRHDKKTKNRILIYGVCDEGNAACHAFTDDAYLPFEMVGFIDDEPGNFGKTINGKRVLGNRHHIGALARLYRVHEVLIAHPDIHRRSEIKRICGRENLRCRIWDPVGDVGLSGRTDHHQEPLHLADLLPPNRFHADLAAAGELLAGKTLLMNGSGGALGIELCRMALQLRCGRLLILDRYESYLNELVASLLKDFPPEKILPLLVNGKEENFPEEVFRRYLPHVVIHAATRKYAPLLGVDLGDAFQTNYLHTCNLARAALKYHCERFVMISSSLAGQKEDSVGDSLRAAEIFLEHFFTDTGTELVVARVCDIVENRGGIASIVDDQIRSHESLTLPSVDARACFISKKHGAGFILQSIVDAKKGREHGGPHLFVCDAGSPIRLTELCERIAGHYGLRLGEDVQLRYTEALANPASRQSYSAGPAGHRAQKSRPAETWGGKAFFGDLLR